MFQLKAAFNEHAEWRTSVERAREFINDLRNFAELMPGVERIIAEASDVARWLIRAEVPAVGSIRQVFPVARAVDLPALIEWLPAAGEKKNLLRYEVSFEELGVMTRAHIRLFVEIRRQSARELHALAAFIGEHRLSAELQKGITHMMRTYLQRARAKLEK
jgi:hypothetical protein